MKQPSARCLVPASFIETLECRTLFSAGSGVDSAVLPTATAEPAVVAAAKTVTPVSRTMLTVSPHSSKLGQNIVASVTVTASTRTSVISGEVEFLLSGNPVIDPNGDPIAVALGSNDKASYTFGPGNDALLHGPHHLSAEFISANSLPGSTSKASTITVTVPKTKTGSDGLVVGVSKTGKGTAVVKAGNTISVMYTGYLASNGQIFDYNNAHGSSSAPFTFQVGAGQVITGFDEGVVGMKVAETRIFGIPAAIGYGANGAPPTIPANADIVFMVTVLSIS